ncbi:MAG: hypothetical protein WAO76_09225, partial [Georgfuchsia sp.]
GAVCRRLKPALVAEGNGASGPDGSFIAPVIFGAVVGDSARKSDPSNSSRASAPNWFCDREHQMNFAGPTFYGTDGLE